MNIPSIILVLYCGKDLLLTRYQRRLLFYLTVSHKYIGFLQQIHRARVYNDRRLTYRDWNQVNERKFGT